MAPRELPRFFATTGPSATLSPFPDFPVLPVIRVPAPPISRRDEEGFSSCSVHPCHRAVATAPPECPAASVSLRRSMQPSPYQRGSASGVRVSGSPVRSLSLRPNDSLTIPTMALSIDFRSSVSFPPGYPSYRTLTFVLVGLTPTEYTCLSGHTLVALLPFVLRVIALAPAHLLTVQSVHRRIRIQSDRRQLHVGCFPDPFSQKPLQLQQLLSYGQLARRSRTARRCIAAVALSLSGFPPAGDPGATNRS